MLPPPTTTATWTPLARTAAELGGDLGDGVRVLAVGPGPSSASPESLISTR